MTPIFGSWRTARKAINSVRLITCLLCLSCASKTTTTSRTALPPLRIAHTIAVPFVSSAEAWKLKYQHKDVMNPSYAASVAMILRYGGQSLSLLEDFGIALREKRGWAIVEQKEDGDIATLKSFLNRDVPVLVVPPMTPVAHPADPVFGMLAAAKKAPAPRVVMTSGALPPMWSLPDYASVKKAVGMDHWESVLLQARVLVGYDDTRGVLIMHDPMIGPAVEISYAEFDQMWAAANRRYTAVEPRVRKAVVPDSSAFSQRNSAQIAVEKFVKAYGLIAAARFQEADDTLRTALSLESLPFEVRYLLLNELGYVAFQRGNIQEALRFADQAGAIGPESPSPWRLRLEIARAGKGSTPAQSRVAADAALKRLCADRSALEALHQSLLPYLRVFSFGCG